MNKHSSSILLVVPGLVLLGMVGILCVYYLSVTRLQSHQIDYYETSSVKMMPLSNSFFSNSQTYRRFIRSCFSECHRFTLGDGLCDPDLNTEDCEYDYGDCCPTATDPSCVAIFVVGMGKS